MPAADLALLLDAAQEAGDIATQYWRQDPQVWDKGDDDPVSEADLAVDRHLRERFLTARPDYGWVSEETEDDLARLDAERVFIVDPIDGTRSFVKGDATWAHSVAVAERGVVTAGVVYLPARGKLYAASLGGGATLNGGRIHVTARTDIEDAHVLSPNITFQPERWRTPPPNVHRHFRPSLAYRLALVAEGRFDAMITLRDAWEWDIAAGALIAEEAGGRVRDRTGATLTFNTRGRQSPGVIAAGPAVTDAVVKGLI